MNVAQSTFSAALLDPSRAAPEGLVNPDGAQAAKRFDVYRNNVAVSLTEALEVAFPVIRKLVGDENFKLLAGAHLRAHPPQSPLLMFYGAQMPAFLEGFEPVRSLGYLPDVARLELALRESYHAADAAPVDPAALAIEPDRLMAARLRLAPSVRLIRSRWPLHAIWAFNMADGPKPQMRAEDVLVTRPDYDPMPQLLPPGGGALVAALAAGQTLAEALDAAGDTDLGAVLGLLLAGGALISIDEDTE